jgi:D-alanyl-lipoteichoic acid acyltransferase DltB (MBOAT superfamily)
VIIAGSLIFYAPFGGRNLLVLAADILVNMLFASLLSKARSAEGIRIPVIGNASAILALAALINVSSLLFYKFSGVFLGEKIFFPVAISFYTFNQISYLVDLYKGEVSGFAVLDYLAYILFFPKLVQGPLMRYADFGKGLERSIDTPFDTERVLRGLLLFSMGLFKKVIMADTFGRAVDHGYGGVSGLGSIEAVLVAVFYSFQLYFDFSGYCDMASGICMILGFDLPVNFDSPYKAVNIVDFWRRWHITLTKFFTRYVYIPLGGNRRGALRMYLNFMIVFLLSGLWHGNGWNFIIWGAMHGVLFVITRALQAKAKEEKSGRAKAEMAKGFAHRAIYGIKILLTFIYVTVAWVFFRAPSISAALTLLVKVFTGGIGPIATRLSACFQLDELWYVIKVTPIMKLPFAWDSCMWLFTAAGTIMIFFCRNALSIAKTAKIGIGTTLLTTFLLVWSVVSFAGVSTFLYMNF